MCFKKMTYTMVAGLCMGAMAHAQNVLEDGGVGMSAQELEKLVQYWTPAMQQAAANDVGDRFELLSMALANKKLAEQLDEQTPEANPRTYWENQFVIRNLKRKLFVNDYMADLVIPDMSALAEETYLTSKEKYALVPESRMTSHVLLRCDSEACNVDEERALAAQILAELQAGAVFETMVEQYSEDPGSKDKGGVFDRWLQAGMDGVSPHYLEGAFKIGGVGEYSAVVESPFGFHIIRLDDIKPQSYRPFEEARADIIAALEAEYKKMAAKEFDGQYRLSDDSYINGPAMDKIFAPYADTVVPTP